jgi:hypothetical protein
MKYPCRAFKVQVLAVATDGDAPPLSPLSGHCESGSKALLAAGDACDLKWSL